MCSNIANPLLRGLMLDIRRYIMDTNPRRKLIVSSITALLLLSSILFLSEVKADPNDLEISNLYEPSGTPPPKANIAYEFMVEWTNDGTSSEDATVRLYADCDQSGTASESATITMGADESGTVNLSITFDDDDADDDETCYSATIYQGGSHYGEFENFVNVEPESGTADLWAEMDNKSIPISFTFTGIFPTDCATSTCNRISLLLHILPISFMG